MEQTKENRERVRKARAPRGTQTQKMVTFRLDNELADWLALQTNKGRYINNLIRADMMKLMDAK